ncbi:MAG TPA: hypothetical protein VEA80_02065 [Vitreimonas sp.]|uniref:hypothetical protein n=1 Tax=Vitreimonas sp. TaxID=3069702 RepID=UPI002D225AFE|nr:hypothetical protein [Vitreimonas sp.]HYD86236.1 hypothetical protein [Vitreimonas sp.]
MENWVFGLAAVSAVASAIAALTSLAQARGTAQGNEVNAYLRLMEDYGDPAMREALLELGRFWRERRDSFPDSGAAWIALNETDPDAAKAIRGHSRLVSNYFGSSARLYEAGLISRKLFRLLISRPGLNVYYEIVVPINVVRNPAEHSAHYVRLMKRVVKQYADGLY